MLMHADQRAAGWTSAVFQYINHLLFSCIRVAPLSHFCPSRGCKGVSSSYPATIPKACPCMPSKRTPYIAGRRDISLVTSAQLCAHDSAVFDNLQADSTEHLRERWAGLFDGGSIDNLNALLDEDGRDDTVGTLPALLPPMHSCNILRRSDFGFSNILFQEQTTAKAFKASAAVSQTL